MVRPQAGPTPMPVVCGWEGRRIREEEVLRISVSLEPHTLHLAQGAAVFAALPHVRRVVLGFPLSRRTWAFTSFLTPGRPAQRRATQASLTLPQYSHAR